MGGGGAGRESIAQVNQLKDYLNCPITLPENALVIANTLFQQHKKRLYTWTSPDGQHQKQIDYSLCNQRCRSSIHLAKKRPGADCGSGHELPIAKFRLKLKEVGKTTRPFKYDLNQIPYYYMVEMTNFKGFKIQGTRSDRVPVSSKPGKRREHF